MSFWSKQPVGAPAADPGAAGPRIDLAAAAQPAAPPAGLRYGGAPPHVALRKLLDDHYSPHLRVSADLLRWRLRGAPWQVSLWNGVRLVGFIAAHDEAVWLHGRRMPIAEVDLLCVHQEARGAGCSPALIAELTRQVVASGRQQAVHFSRVWLPTPVATLQLQHRSLERWTPSAPPARRVSPETAAPVLAAQARRHALGRAWSVAGAERWLTQPPAALLGVGTPPGIVALYIRTTRAGERVARLLAFAPAAPAQAAALLGAGMHWAQQQGAQRFEAFAQSDVRSVLPGAGFVPARLQCHTHLFNWAAPQVPAGETALIGW